MSDGCLDFSLTVTAIVWAMSGFRSWRMSVVWFFICYSITRTLAVASDKSAQYPFISCATNGSFHCIDGGVCIPQEAFCDGNEQCPDGSDEVFCGNRCAGDNWFSCRNNHCISKHWRCDGENDCMDWSDEEDCEEHTKKIASRCGKNEFECNNGLCILDTWKCDGFNDCKNGEDEEKNLCMNETRTCPEFTCKTGECLPTNWVCDGGRDCADGSDEADCGGAEKWQGQCLAENGRFSCQDGSACLEFGQVCDGEKQCGDGSDEGAFCGSSADCSSLSCQHGCVRGEAGPSCFCRPGFSLERDGVTCVDVDECQKFGRCSQACENTPGNFTCSCLSGYAALPGGGGTCLAAGAEPTLYFASTSEVRGLRVRSSTFLPVSSGLHQVIGVAYDGVEGRVYWTSILDGVGSIMSSRENGDDVVEVVGNGLGMPEDIAIDQLSRNIYFTDSHRNHLAVCRLDGAACTILVKEIAQPRAVRLHHRNHLVLYTDWGDAPAVVIMGMDGSDRRNLVEQNLHWPNGLAVDEVLDRIYWSDAKKDIIETVKLDGSDRREVLKDIVHHPFSMAVFEDTLYWSDWEKKEVQSCNKFTGKSVAVLVKEAGLHPMGITITHPLMTEKLSSPCEGNTCSHLCLPRPTMDHSHITCACPGHLSLSSDLSTCQLPQKTSYLVVSTGRSIYRLEQQSLGRDRFEELGSLDTGVIISMAYDNFDKSLYVSNKVNNKIHQFDEFSKSFSSDAFSAGLGAIAMDSLSGNIYWIDSEKSVIMVRSLSTSAQTVLPIVEPIYPTSLLFIQNKTRLVFSDVQHVPSSSPKGRILTCSPDGSSVTVVPNLDMLVNPMSLSYHHSTNSVFIADSGTVSVYQWEVDTGTVRTFLTGLGSIVSTAIISDRFFWLQQHSNNLYWVDLNSGNSRIRWESLDGVTKSPVPGQRIMRLGEVNNERSSNPRKSCSTAHCSHLCFAEQDNTTCSCPFGMVLATDQVTCRQECPDEVFKCTDGQCVRPEWRCDGAMDCQDGSDELNCEEHLEAEGCPDGEIACANGTCINKAWWCDGDIDCPDKSDETSDCPTITCNYNQFRCDNERVCILKNWRCDGTRDCNDGSDELRCEMTCAENEFRCVANEVCINKAWVCDGSPDCGDGSDETDCGSDGLACSGEEMRCDNGNCVDLGLTCDGQDDCGDASDEARGLCPHSLRDEEEQRDPCENGFRCDSTCHPVAVRCNGTAECSDTSDEMDCTVCTADTYRCLDGEMCIRQDWVCDNKTDCTDGSDEADCGYLVTLPPHLLCRDDQYQCGTGKCIELQQACDNVFDCEDGSDEHPENCLLCGVDNGHCPQLCLPTPHGPVCQCKEGFRLVSVNGTVDCLDKDECEDIGSCAQHCANTKGGFKCYCVEGYVPEMEGRLCRASGGQPRLMYTTGKNIRAVEISSKGNRAFAELTNKTNWYDVRSFDFDHKTGYFYWTSSGKGAIMRHLVGDGIGRVSGKKNIWVQNIVKPDQVVLDWSTGNVYYSRQGSGEVVVCSGDEARCSLVVDVNVGTITQMAVDAAEVRLFVIGYSRDYTTFPEGGIWTYGLDGASVDGVERIGGAKISRPSGLTLDLVMKRVYWSDWTTREISVCDYNGGGVEVVKRSLQYHPDWLSMYESTLYWVSGKTGVVNSHNIVRNVTEVKYDLVLPRYARDLRFVQESRQPDVSNPCEEMACTEMCLPKLGGGARCACPRGSIGTDESARECIFPVEETTRTLADQVDQLYRTEKGLEQLETNLERNGDVSAQPSSNSLGQYHGRIAGVVVGVLVVVVLAIAAVFWIKKRGFKKGTAHGFGNPAYGDRQTPNNNMSFNIRMDTVEAGRSTNTYDNPAYDSPAATNICTNSKLSFLKSRSGPTLSSSDWPESPNLGRDEPIVVKGCSTPTKGRFIETDSAYTEPSIMSHEPSIMSETDDIQQHLSVSYHTDKIRLLE